MHGACHLNIPPFSGSQINEGNGDWKNWAIGPGQGDCNPSNQSLIYCVPIQPSSHLNHHVWITQVRKEYVLGSIPKYSQFPKNTHILLGWELYNLIVNQQDRHPMGVTSFQIGRTQCALWPCQMCWVIGYLPEFIQSVVFVLQLPIAPSSSVFCEGMTWHDRT